MPLVSCILATKDRPHFLARAIDYYLRQTLPDTELVIVDDGSQSCEALVPRAPHITYLRLANETPLGTKLNLGIEASSGRVIQKLDDDDYYHPRFLEVMTSALSSSGRFDVIAGVERLLVLISATGDLVDAGGGWFAGGTYCFLRDTWKQHPFRDVPGGRVLPRGSSRSRHAAGVRPRVVHPGAPRPAHLDPYGARSGAAVHRRAGRGRH
ncbi:glycosyltransferase family 2 protein [Streptomyces sp. NPDC097617]|uniref:glycosyltransferase family 2 protein n=1 Tax=Streptomyces sp. NPDC097617 TaxID=3366091 RepID=UPI00382A478B